MKKFDYGVVILNYNVSDDAICAAQSVIKNAVKYSYIICLADNDSPKNNEIEKLESVKSANCEVIKIQKNNGYARGNNEAIRHLLRKYEISYFIIMNPDVLIIKKGTIDRLIDRIAVLPESYCGISPLIWTPSQGEDAKKQINVIHVPNYWDSVIDYFHFFKLIWKKRYARYVYKEEMSQLKEFDFEVPCGAFFIMRNKSFVDVDLFDERTFLYGEERILGYKLKMRGYKFLFSPNEMVQHEGGKSTNSTPKRVKWKAIIFGMDSADVYLRNYLHCSEITVFFTKLLIALNWGLKKMKYMMDDIKLLLVNIFLA